MTPRDARAGGRWTRRQWLKNAAIRGLVRGLLALADRLPAPLLLAACRALGRLTPWVAPALARRARHRAALALPADVAERATTSCFVNAGTSLAATLLLRRPQVRPSDWIEIDAAARRELEQAGGAVVVSAHLGPFELVAPAVAEAGLDPAVVVRESYDPGLDAHVDRHRLARGVTVIHRGRPGAGTRIVRSLRRGKLVGLLPDLPARVESVPVAFLGQTMAMPSGPARVARAARVPLLICTLAPLPGSDRFRLHVRRIDLPRGSLQAMTQRVASALSEAISAAPEWWLWMAAPSPG